MSVEDTGAKQETLRETMERVMAEKQADAPVDASPEQSAPTEPAIADTETVDAAPEPEAAEPGGDTDGASPEDAPASEHAEPPAFEPPQHWSKEDKDRFLALDDGAKEFLLDRAKALEKTQLQKHRELDAQGREYEAVLGKIPASMREQMALKRVSLDQAVGEISAYWSQLNNPETTAAALTQLVQQYGPSLGTENGRKVAQAFINAAGLSTDALLDEHDPDLDSPGQATIADLKREIIQEVRQELQTQRQETQRETQASSVDQEIQAFRTATDSKGGLAYPHYAALEPNIAHMIEKGDERLDRSGSVRDLLGSAYKAALSDLSGAIAPPKPATVRRRTETSVAKSSPTPGNGVIAPPKNLHDHIRQVADRIRSA